MHEMNRNERKHTFVLASMSLHFNLGHGNSCKCNELQWTVGEVFYGWGWDIGDIRALVN
jgi:hypothetical protein